MKITNKNLTEIMPYEKNPRLNDNAVEAVANSINEFGFKVPIVISKENIIIAGHTRYKAAKQLGIEEVPCIIADDLSDEQVKAFRLADNKVSELSTWDFDLLDEELESLESLQKELESMSFEFDFEDIALEDFFSPEVKKKPKASEVKNGQEPVNQEPAYEAPQNNGVYTDNYSYEDDEEPVNEQYPGRTLYLEVHVDQLDLINSVIKKIYDNNELSITYEEANEEGNAIYEICRQWAEQRNLI